VKDDGRDSLLNPHLTSCVQMFVSREHTVDDFPFEEALNVWENKMGIKRRSLHAAV